MITKQVQLVFIWIINLQQKIGTMDLLPWKLRVLMIRLMTMIRLHTFIQRFFPQLTQFMEHQPLILEII